MKGIKRKVIFKEKNASSGHGAGQYEVKFYVPIEEYRKLESDAAFFGVETVACLNMLIGNSIEDLHIMAAEARKTHGDEFSPPAGCNDCGSDSTTQ